MSSLSNPSVPSSSWQDKIEEEMDSYLEKMKSFCNMPSNEVLQLLSGFSARATELKIQLNRSEKAASKRFVEKQIDVFISECDRQFKVHSRIQAVQEFEAKMFGVR